MLNNILPMTVKLLLSLSGKMSVVVCAMPTWVSWKLGVRQEDKTVGAKGVGVGVGVRAEQCQRSEVF